MPKKFFQKIILPSLIFLLLFGALAVFATERCVMTELEEHPPTIEWPASPFGSPLDATTDIPNLVKYLFEWGVGLGGLAMFIALIIAGVQYITSVAEPNKLNEAKDRIKSAVIGLALLLSSWAIFNLINPNLNELQDVSKIMESVRLGAASIDSSKTCNTKGLYAWECCRLPATECDPAVACESLPGKASDPLCCMDENCKSENYACCRQNDADCIAGEVSVSSRYVVQGSKVDGDECKNDSNCDENYCKCFRDPDGWYQECEENPLVCIQVIGSPEAGCDFIGFYSDIGFKGESIFVQVKSQESGWLDPPAEGGKTIPDILSFQAFKAAKNRTGTGTEKYIDDNGNPVNDINQAHKIPCGVGGCGCKIAMCAGGKTTAKSGCLKDTLVEFNSAYSLSVEPSIEDVVNIYDESRSLTNWFKNLF